MVVTILLMYILAQVNVVSKIFNEHDTYVKQTEISSIF